jgi:hypothetical protein
MPSLMTVLLSPEEIMKNDWTEIDDRYDPKQYLSPTTQPPEEPVNTVMVFLADREDLWTCGLEIRGLKYYGIIDTGASVNVMSSSYYETLPEPRPEMIDSNMKFRVADGTVTAAMGKCEIKMKVAGKPLIQWVYVNRSEKELFLLGKSWLKDAEVGRIDLTKSSLIFTDGRECDMYETSEAGVHFLSVTRDVLIPAHSKVLTYVNYSKSLQFPEKALLLCDSLSELQDEYSADIVSGTTKHEKGRAKLVLFNNSDEVVQVK